VGLDNAGNPARVRLDETWTRCQLLVKNFPLEGLEDLRVGFDLMGEGEVWIDDVKIYDTLFEASERDELRKSNFTTRQVQLGAGRLGECQRYLDGYWPSFLMRHVPASAAAQASPGNSAGNSPTSARDGSTGAINADKPAETASKSTWDKMKGWLPKSWR
jgi:hypothetical protein